MPEQEFELYLSLLGKLLKLNSNQTASIRDELRDHMEQRLEELADQGVERTAAIRLALDEFGDAASLADDFARLARDRRRRRMLRWTLAGSVTAAAALLLTFAFWPVGARLPQSITVQADDAVAFVNSVKADNNQATTTPLFADTEPSCVDPARFLPEPLTLNVGTAPVVASLEELPRILEEKFGVVAILDEVRIEEIGIGLDSECRLDGGVPLYLSLDRTLMRDELDWYWDRDVLHITSREHQNERLTARQYVVRDLLHEISEETLIEVVENSTGDEERAPWLNMNGTGGTLSLFGDILSVRQTRIGQAEVEALLTGLAESAPELWLGESRLHLQLREGLQALTVAADFEETELSEVIARLESESGLSFGIDETRLEENGVSLDEPVTLHIPARPLGQVLELLLTPLHLSAITQNGQVFVTSSEYAQSVLRTVLYDARDFAAESNLTTRLIDAIQNQTGDEDDGPWLDVHGTGGVISSPLRGVLVIRQTEQVHGEIRQLIADIRQSLATRPPTPPQKPERFETRFYRLPASMAEDLLKTIPRRISRGQWNDPIEDAGDPNKGTMEVVSVGSYWNGFPLFGGFGSGMGGGGGGGGLE
ncbi:MAG: hypothetical protein KDA75_13480, partial [Planctomycetaceae bacterium]|nr:hypothetical protein [Planctomycetaceae bacterium]